MGTAFLNNWFLCLSFASYNHCSHPQEPLLIPTTDWEDARSLGTEVDLQVIRQAGDTRALHIMQLRNLADEIDLLYQTFNNEKIKGNGISLVGGGVGLASSIATFATGGLAIPAAGVIGFLTSIGGGMWNNFEATKKEKRKHEIMNMLVKLVADDNKLQEEVRHERKKFEYLDQTSKYILAEQLRGYGVAALIFGPEDAAKETAAQLRQLLSSAQLSSAQTAGQTAGEKWAGSAEIGIGIGVISCVWDTFQISEAWDGSKKGAQTDLGIALRSIASQREDQKLNRSG